MRVRVAKMRGRVSVWAAEMSKEEREKSWKIRGKTKEISKGKWEKCIGKV